MRFAQLKLGPMANFSYVFGDSSTGSGTIVDPGFERAKLAAVAREMGLRVEHVLLTHGHFDHVQEAEPLRRETGARVVAHPRSPVRPDVAVEDGQPLSLGGVTVLPVFTPGHEPSAVCYVVADQWLLTGDTVFIGECGRVDLPGSDVGLMWDSLVNRIPRLPGHLIVCPGHDYGPAPTDTLANQLATNYTLKKRTRAEFERFMAEP